MPTLVRNRMDYAFRVFAAIYDHPVSESLGDQQTRTFIYGDFGSSANHPGLRIPALYQPASANVAFRSFSKVSYSGEQVCLFHGRDPSTGHPDWLGELFEWLSSSHETGISVRDSVGRIPDSEMIFSACGILPSVPQAAIFMGWLEHYAATGASGEAIVRAPSPIAAADHLVVCSHDIDYYFTNRASALKRLVKNLGISLMIYKSWAYFCSNAALLTRLLSGARVGDYLPPLFRRLEECEARSTLFVVPVHGHRRDPNYALRDLAPQIKEAAQRGFSVEIHGSYSSMLENHTLKPEARALQQVTARPPSGNRQHWLRFDDQQALFRAIAEAGLIFDSSLGFTDTVGFRNGACFAFPPYDFSKEKPHQFLEIPLAIMDGSLVEQSLATAESPRVLADRVLNASRKFGWGGISILWHNPLEALSVPEEINQIFWDLARQQQQNREKWVSTDQFLSMSLPRYHAAGLLQDVTRNTRGD